MAMTQTDPRNHEAPELGVFLNLETTQNNQPTPYREIDSEIVELAHKSITVDVHQVLAQREQAQLEHTNYALLGQIVVLWSQHEALRGADSVERLPNYWDMRFVKSAQQRVNSLLTQPGVLASRIVSGVTPAVEVLTDNLEPQRFQLGDNQYAISVCTASLQRSAELFRVDDDDTLVAFGLPGVTFHNRDGLPVDVTNLETLPRHARWEDYVTLAEDLEDFRAD